MSSEAAELTSARDAWRRVVSVAWAALATLSSSMLAQETGPGLVVPVPPPSVATVRVDTFTSPHGERRAFEVHRSAHANGPVPIVVFVNANGPALRNARSYQEWARLVTSRGLAGVLYDGPAMDPTRSQSENVQGSVAHLDSLLAALQRRGRMLGVDPEHVVVWAGSGQTFTGTPFALSGNRPIMGYVLYYGAGDVADLRIDVPVFVARAGSDSPSLNRGLDSLVERLTQAGVPVTMVTYPAGSHGFDIVDSTAMSAFVIRQTLDFMTAVTHPLLKAAITHDVPEARASSAFANARWAEAEQRYTELGQQRPASRVVAWRLGLAQLENGHAAAALTSFDRAKALGQGGARDIGLPAARAAVRSGNTPKAVEWIRWALQSYASIRAEIQADHELAPLLEHPLVKGW